MEKETDREQLAAAPAKVDSKADFGDVMVVGGGISGIQAALDLATSGFKVFLVEKSPTIGGKMAQLDKTFPTNDCSMCIESPKFIECDRHPNIEILTYTEVERVEGEAGNFTVSLVKKPRYIIEGKCTGCTTCREYCPVTVPDPFNQDLSSNKAIHIYFSQAVPLVTYIDENCLYLKDKKCAICKGVCKNDAIDFLQEPEKRAIKVGAIVLSPGYEVFDPALRGDYGYGRFENVVTSLDFERLLCATGPHEGEILRPSDKKHPHNIAWIHCVGSRQVLEGGNSYCSSVCCTYIQKQVILTKDHDADARATIFHNDIRSYGKDFERFYQRAEKLPGIRFIRSYVEVGREIPGTKNVTIKYSTPDEGVKEEEFDLVVLGVGLNPPLGAKKLAETFGIELTDHGFCKSNPTNPIQTSRPGVFVSGAFHGPIDIPESVMTASGTNALVGGLLDYRRGKLSRERLYPPERDVTKEEPKVGVFVCHCGANIGRVVNVPSVVEYALTLGKVAHAEEGLFICSTDAAEQIAKTIREKGLNRVVVAACTPRTHEPLFQDTLREGGINKYFFDMANIREHCSWVHSKQKEEATEKAKGIVRMSVARAIELEPLQEFKLPVNKSALVVGGGPAGMTSALALASQGFPVHLVEKEPVLGGMARRIHSTLEGLDVQKYLTELIRRVYQHPLIQVSHSAVITQVSGYVGNFTTTVKSEGQVKTIRHGAAIIAIGAEEYKPSEYLYGKDVRVMTSVELGERIGASNRTPQCHSEPAGEESPGPRVEEILRSAQNDIPSVLSDASSSEFGVRSSQTQTAEPKSATDSLQPATTGHRPPASSLPPPASSLQTANCIVMIQCVGCRRPEDRNYCSRVCCSHSVKNALKLKELNPQMDIHILFRDMRTYGFSEDYYREAADKDVKFVRWEPNDPPQVTEATSEEGKPVLRVSVPDPILGKRLELDADLVVLAAAIVPAAGSQEISRLFKVPLSPDGFFQEAHVKLRPVDFAADGVFLCGTAHYPKHIMETISQAYGAAGRAATLLSQETVTASGAVCEVQENDCVSCGACITACKYDAIEFYDTPKGKKARVNPVLCKGDGLCNAKCPTNAIVLKHYSNEEILSQIDAALTEA